MKRFVVLEIVCILFLAFPCFGQETNNSQMLSFEHGFTERIVRGQTTKARLEEIVTQEVISYDLMELSYGIGALITMYEATDSLYYINYAFSLVNRTISNAEKSKGIRKNPEKYKDEYKGWINVNPNYKNNKRRGPGGVEVPLFESYFFRYVAKMLYIARENNLEKKSTLISSSYNPILNYLEKNGWKKWYQRGVNGRNCYRYLFRSTAYMTSHWAIVALYLREIGKDKSQYPQYNFLLYMYDHQLRDNLRITDNDAYIWNATWDESWPYRLDCNPPTDNPVIQDSSHGNHVIAYIIEAYNLGHEWTKLDVSRFIRTVKTILYDSEHQYFYADLNKKVDRNPRGMKYADGFLKLARFDEELLQIFDLVRNANKKTDGHKFSSIHYIAQYKMAQKCLSDKQKP